MVMTRRETPIAMYYGHLKTLDASVAFHAGLRPEQTAVICEDRGLGYGELHRRSNRVAHALLAAGVRRGDRVVYIGQESEHYYILLFACAKAGIVLVPVNWRLTAPEVEYLLQDCGARFTFVEPTFALTVKQASQGLRRPPTEVTVIATIHGGPDFAAWVAGAPDTDLDVSAEPDDPIVQMYTSGTTGLPKGVVLAHRSFFQVRDALFHAGLDWIDWRPDDVSLLGVPGFHIGGLWWALQGFNAGVTNVVLRMFTGATAVAAIRQHRITVGCVVPAMLQQVLAERSVSRADFASLRKIVYGGSPIGESLLERCLDRIGCEFAQIYGLTESGNTAVCLPPSEHVLGGPRMTAAGRPYPGFTIDIRDEAGQSLPTGAIGEVWIRTPAHMIEYWGLPEATTQTLVDGWLRTGDAGRLDEDGFLFICDRIKDTIIVAGENVYPAEVENVLTKHDAVIEAAVIGIPDERWGEAVHACVVLTPGAQASGRELMVFCRNRLAGFKIPTSYDYIDRLPRNASGKILRRELRDGYWQGRARKIN
jgi:acyl-CoA synthetase (AMP-forming)/AMP-acid ligase II